MQADQCMSMLVNANEQGQLESVAEGVQEHLAALDAGLARRLAIAAARSLLELMHDTAHALSKVLPHPRAGGALHCNEHALQDYAGLVMSLHGHVSHAEVLMFHAYCFDRPDHCNCLHCSLRKQRSSSTLELQCRCSMMWGYDEELDRGHLSIIEACTDGSAADRSRRRCL